MDVFRMAHKICKSIMGQRDIDNIL